MRVFLSPNHMQKIQQKPFATGLVGAFCDLFLTLFMKLAFGIASWLVGFVWYLVTRCFAMNMITFKLVADTSHQMCGSLLL